jgi:hypothetical protein
VVVQWGGEAAGAPPRPRVVSERRAGPEGWSCGGDEERREAGDERWAGGRRWKKEPVMRLREPVTCRTLG